MWDQVIIFFAQYVYLVITGVAFCFVVFSDSLIRKKVLMIGIVSSIIALITEKILTQIIISPRPFMTEGVTALFPHVASNGFPSEHVLFAMVISYTIFLFNKKLGGILALLTLGIGVARVLTNVHHPIDIIGGIIIGIAAVCAGRYIFRLFGLKIMTHFGVEDKS